MAKRKPQSSATKSDLVRQYIARHPEHSITAIQQGMHEQGIDISRALASKIKYSRVAPPGAKRRGRKGRKPAAASAAGAATKADLIRAEIRRQGPRFRPRDVVAELEQQGVTVMSSHVIAIAKSLGMKRRRRGRPAGAVTRSSATRTDRVSLDDLVAAKRLVEKLGGIEAASKALAALARLT